MITVEAPALTQPLVIAESGTLTEYLCDHFAQHLIPKRYQEGKEGQVGGETEEWLRYRFYMHYAEGSLMTLLLIGLFMDRKFGVFICPFLQTDRNEQKFEMLLCLSSLSLSPGPSLDVWTPCT